MYYWRKGGKEVDFIIKERNKIIPVEVKYKKVLSTGDMKNLLYLLEKFKIPKAIVIYEGETKRINKKIIAINFLEFLFKGEMSLE